MTAAAAWLAQGSVLMAASPSPPAARWTVRGEFVVNTPSDPLPGNAVVAISVARRVARAIAVEGSLGAGLPVTTIASDATGATRDVDIGSGLHAALLFRFHRTLTASGRSSLSLAAGPSLVSGSAFGTVPMARVELGFDRRIGGAGIFFAGIGYEIALATSREPFPAAECATSSGCPPRYQAGHGQVTSRFGAGLTF